MKELRLVLLLVLAASLAGCATSGFGMSFVRVEFRHPGAERQTIEVSEGDTWEDDTITVAWTPSLNTVYPLLYFSLTNKGDDTLTLPWDDACIIGPDGAVHSVFHKGIPYIRMAEPQAPSVIPAGATLHDLLCPAGAPSWKKTTLGYFPLLLFPVNKTQTLEGYHGKHIQVFLPLDANGVRREYTFIFQVNLVALNTQKGE